MTRRLALLARALPLLVLVALAMPAPAWAHANYVRSEPASGVATPVPPSEVRIWFTEPPEVRYSSIEVYDANRNRYDQGAARLLPGDPLGLVVAVRPLPEGIYTVVWRANSTVDGHTTTGSFAFAVGTTPPPPSLDDAGASTVYVPPGPAEVAVKWLMLLAATAFTGALGLRWLVWAPALRQSGALRREAGRDVEATVDRRLLRLAGAALAVLFAATVAGLVQQLIKSSGSSLAGALDPSALGDFLFGTRPGANWLARLLVVVVAAMFLGPELLRAARPARGAAGEGRGPGDERGEAATPPTAAPTESVPLAPRPSAVSLFGLALGAFYLLAISLMSHGAASPLWTPFTIALDWFHLLATSVWVGGLLGLVLTVPLVRRLSGRVRPLLLELVSRFSTIGLVSVATLTITGLYSAWLHVGSFDALLPTAYGRALVLKLVLVAGMVALGAFNYFWVRPRLAAAETGEGAGLRLLGRFSPSIRAEALLGVLILLVVALLTGLAPAREAIVQARAPKRTQTATAGDLRITLTLSSLQPGETTFDVLLQESRSRRPVDDAEKVALRINMVEMDMGEAEAVLEPRGDGHYVGSGSYLAMSGEWTARVIVRRPARPDAETTFRLAIGGAANVAATPTAPTPPRLPALEGVTPLGLGLLVALFVASFLAGLSVRLLRSGTQIELALLLLLPLVAVLLGAFFLMNRQGQDAGASVPRNPVPADAASVASGQALFAANCAACHGPTGRGDGPAAVALNPRPVDLSLPHTATHPDGALFDSITNGVPGTAMQPWRDQLTERQRWDLVNFIRTLNPLTAGTARGSASPQAPQAAQATPAARAATPASPAATGSPASASPGATPGSAGAASPRPPAQPATPGAGAVPGGSPASGATGPPTGRLIYASDGFLWAVPAAGGRPTNLTPDLPPNTYAADPALSPDGATLVYTTVLVPPVGQPQTPATLPGSDLHLMDATGGEARLLFEHDRPGVLISRPAWTPDGTALVYAYSAPVIDSAGRYVDTTREIQRLDIATGQRTTLVRDGIDPAVAPAGAGVGLAYVVTDPASFETALWVAGADGQGPRKLLGGDSGLRFISAPQFSPDGRSLVFAASGDVVGEPGRGATSAGMNGALTRLSSPHGEPKHLWVVALDGGGLRKLTTEPEDDPSPVWSPDGSRVAFLSGRGLFVIGADVRELTRVVARSGTGPIVWAPR